MSDMNMTQSDQDSKRKTCKRQLPFFLFLPVLGAIVHAKTLRAYYWPSELADVHTKATDASGHQQFSSASEEENSTEASKEADFTVEHAMKRQRPVPSNGSTCIYFNHFPKTGGTSVLSFLEDIARQLNYTMFYWYGHKPPDGHSNGYFGEEFPLPNRTYHHNAINTGHKAPRSFQRMAKLQDCYTFTVLREPVDRAISHFYYRRFEFKDWDDYMESVNKIIVGFLTFQMSRYGEVCVDRQYDCVAKKTYGYLS